MKFIQPPFLKTGDCIGITCPAGFLAPEKSAHCIRTLQQWGYEVMAGHTLQSHSENYFSGTDEERMDELQAMLDDPSINAIIFGRGGYGMSRIIDKLSFRKFLKHPKWLAGFSDITVLHNHLFANYQIASIHSSMAAEFQKGTDDNENVKSLKKMLEGEPSAYKIVSNPYNATGRAEGNLIGGNLALLAHLIGTKSDYDTSKKIFFIEDVGEYLYNIDRMLNQLSRASKFKRPAAVIFGEFTDIKDTTRPFGEPIEEILKNYTRELDCPVVFNFPVGHGKHNLALKHGGRYSLQVTKKIVTLKEI